MQSERPRSRNPQGQRRAPAVATPRVERRGAKGPATPAPEPAVEALTHGAMRTCVGCRGSASRDALVRMISGPDGQVAVDMSGRAGGRGAWVHPVRVCFEKAASRHGIERTLKVPPRPVDGNALVAQARESLERRAQGLVLSAQRARRLAVGMAAVVEATERSTAQLLLVTADAGNHTLAAAERWEAAGILLRKFSTRESLGTSLNRGEVAIVAVLDPGIAAELTTTFDRFAALEDG